MAKGWESKSVEEQQSESTAASTSAEQERQAAVSAAERKRKIQALELQREHILSQRTSSPHRRTALELALADIERMLQELGYSIHL